MKIAAVLAMVCAAGSTSAQDQSPAPAFAVKSIFQDHLALRFADRCPDIDFDPAGHDAHIRNRLAEFRNRGISGQDVFKKFAPIAPHRYRAHVRRFTSRHGLTGESTLEDFCDVARREIQERSVIGAMMKIRVGAAK